MRSMVKATFGKLYDLPEMPAVAKRPDMIGVVHAIRAKPGELLCSHAELRELALTAMDASTEANLWRCWRRS